MISEITQAFFDEGHPVDALEGIGYRLAKDQLGPVMFPLAQVLLTIVGKSPEVLLNRYDTFVKQSLRGFKVAYSSSGKRSGTLEYDYGISVPSWYGVFTRGALRVTFEVTGFPEAVIHTSFLENHRKLRLDVSW
jgi:hypothetical protein